jgi:hypothetical protein
MTITLNEGRAATGRTRTMFEVPDEAVTRVRVLIGEDEDAERRGDKQLAAWSHCTYYCRDAKTVEACVEAIRDSDERLRSRPEEMMLWDWQSTYFQADPDSEEGGGTIILGVAWYDRSFYNERRDAGLGYMHKRIYERIGLLPYDIKIEHYLADPQPGVN